VEPLWRGEFTSDEVDRLHAEAFGGRARTGEERDWRRRCEAHSLGWVVARDGNQALAGFVNVVWDGLVHAWLQDVMVAATARRQGLGVRLVGAARDGATAAGCEYLHVDFVPGLGAFYLDACGFSPTQGGLLRLG
jgi:GNAT superfamily N-acetyltransferase